MLASRAAGAGSSLTRSVGTMLAGSPGADVAATVGSSVAGAAAQGAGLGPVGQAAASVAGGMLTASGAGKAAGKDGLRAKPGGKTPESMADSVSNSSPLHKTGTVTFKNEIEQTTWLRNAESAANRVDGSGCIDIAGVKVHFGTKGADGQWETANELFKHVSIPDLEKSIVRGRADADKLHEWYTAQAARPPYPGAPSGDRLRVACTGTINGKPVVTGPDGGMVFGRGADGEHPFIGKNQNAIAPDRRGQGPTLTSNEAAATGKARYGERAKYPNSTIDNAHAEIAFLQKAHDAGLIKQGDSITIPVTGQAVCQNCVEHLPLMAEKMGIQFMTVIEKKTGIIYYWRKGMSELERLGE